MNHGTTNRPPTRILGIDPGTLRTGFGVLDVSGRRIVLHESGVISGRASETAAERLGAIAGELGGLIDRLKPACVALESSFFGKNAHSLIRLGEARGMVLALAGGRGLAVHDYSPASVKKSVTGSGSASKEQVARALSLLLPGLGPASAVARLDQTDAIASAWCHAHRERGGPGDEKTSLATGRPGAAGRPGRPGPKLPPGWKLRWR